MEASNRGITYVDDGIIYYRASSFGQCPRALYASRKGYDPTPPPPAVREAFAYGTEHESIVTKRYEELTGYHVTDQQREVSFKCGPVTLVGHIDGIANGKVFDVKCLSADNYSKWLKYGWESFPTYAWQLSIYARAVGCSEVTMVTLNKETDELHYIDLKPKYRFSDFLERVLEIEAAVSNDNSVQPACIDTGFYCPYNYLHDTMFDDVDLSGGIDQLRQNELWELANEYRSLKRKETEFRNSAAAKLHDIEIRLGQTETSLKVCKTGANQPLSISRVSQTRRDIDKELLGQYLQHNGQTLGNFERTSKLNYIRVSVIKRKAEKDDSPTNPE